MKSKKAILPKEVLNIVLAIACIVLLVYLGYKLYGLASEQHELQQARAHLTNIMGIISALENAGGGERSYILYSPKGWALSGWPYANTKPKSCKEEWKSCICFCKSPFLASYKESVLSKTWEALKYFFGKKRGYEIILKECNDFSVCEEIKYSQESFVLSYDTANNYKKIPLSINLIDKSKKPIKISLKEGNLKIVGQF